MGPGPQLVDPGTEDGVLASEALPAQFFQQAGDGNVGMTVEPVADRFVVGIEQTRSLWR